ncbi:hypothetical protein [Nostoc sp. KVJ3]|uniref:hypothetical protein n=1 Tax=Nostoc sp. KVJ3 TaxID=457945 RepID=UPI002237C10E|nr:hypothetical protein [Nostoc sp. KVJ3]
MEVKSEVTIKFSGSLPTATPLPNKKVAIELTDQNGIVFTAQVNAKSWRKLKLAPQNLQTGLGPFLASLVNEQRTGLRSLTQESKLFEKKAKEVKPDVAAAEAGASS